MRALLLLLFSACLACAWLPSQAPPKRSQDDVIHDKVLQKLASDRDVKGGGIDVEVHEGVVTLRGKVLQEKQKAKATRLARKVKGVKQVINDLRVELPPEHRGP